MRHEARQVPSWLIFGLGKIMKRHPVTAGELVAQLEADPDYQARMQKRRAELAPIWEQRRKDEARLVEELRAAGFPVESVFDFVNTAEEYPEALPILVRHLDLPHDPCTRDGIIRALTIKYGGVGIEEALLRHFYAESDSQIRWTLANALTVAMPPARRKKHPEIKMVHQLRKMPNKAPEPTPGAVTPRATEGTSK